MQAKLLPLTDEACRAVPDGEISITAFPFRVGRDGRAYVHRLGLDAVGRLTGERRHGTAPGLNDVYLVEQADSGTCHVSREHFLIDVDDDGEFYVVDRGSECGTLVGDRAIGGGQGGGRAPLRGQDTITVGTGASPFVFQFFITERNAVRRRPSVNANVVKPSEVVRQLQMLVPFLVTANMHVRAWQHYKVRPASAASEPDRTNQKFCVYDHAHADYLYTPAWIEFLARELSQARTYEIVTRKRAVPSGETISQPAGSTEHATVGHQADDVLSNAS